MHSDGTIVRVQSGGKEKRLRVTPIPPMSSAQVEARAASDPDNPPITPARRARLRPVPRLKTLRRALGLTQEEFAERYRIPRGTLRDWEQGRTEPDQTARAYLTVIAHEPQGVVQALWAVTRRPRPGGDSTHRTARDEESGKLKKKLGGRVRFRSGFRPRKT